MTEFESRRTPYDDAYETCERTYAALLVYPGESEPEFVTRRLGVEPTSTQSKGERIRNSLGRERIVSVNGWFLSSEGKVRSLDVRRHLDWLLEKLMPAEAGLKELQKLPKVKLGVSCVWWSAGGQGGPTLWPEQMARMAQLNLECSFDIAFFGEDAEE